jgi:hypothetical protein
MLSPTGLNVEAEGFNKSGRNDIEDAFGLKSQQIQALESLMTA